MKKLFFFSISLLVSQAVFATGVFNWIVNNVTSGGHVCGMVSETHYEKFSSQFSRSPEIIQRTKNRLTPLQMFEQHLHHEASLLYQRKTPCLSDFASQISGTNGAIEELRKSATVVWLNRRKAQLFLRHCTLIQNEISKLMSDGQGTGSISADRSEKYKIENLVRRNPQIDPYYSAECQRKTAVAASMALVKFSEQSLSFLSSRELLDIIQANRDMLIFSQTNQALTDRELLRLDLNSKSKPIRFSVELAIKADRAIITYIQAKLNQRNAFSQRLQPAKFERDLFQILYDDGVVEEALQSFNLTKDHLRADPDLNRMMACTRANYDTSFIGSTVDFVVLFAVARGALGKVRGFNTLPRLLKEGIAATVAAAGPIVDSCLQRKNLRSDQLKSSRSEALGGPHKTHLPHGFNIDFYSLESVPIESINSCRETNQDHLTLQKAHVSTCLTEALYNILPATLGFGVMAAMMAGE